MVDDNTKEPTNPATPNAKKSSGTWKLNLDSAICGRGGCGHIRANHETRSGGSHRWSCKVTGCACPEFVIGGADYETMPDVLTRSTPPPTKKT